MTNQIIKPRKNEVMHTVAKIMTAKLQDKGGSSFAVWEPNLNAIVFHFKGNKAAAAMVFDDDLNHVETRAMASKRAGIPELIEYKMVKNLNNWYGPLAAKAHQLFVA